MDISVFGGKDRFSTKKIFRGLTSNQIFVTWLGEGNEERSVDSNMSLLSIKTGNAGGKGFIEGD